MPKETYLLCTEHRADDTHNVMILERNGNYDCYLMEHDGEGHETPYLFMFGLPMGQQTYSEAVDMAIANALNYRWMFDYHWTMENN